MFKTFGLTLALVASVASAPMAIASPASDQAAMLAQGLQSMVGPQEGKPLYVSKIVAEGEVLVIVVNGPAGWRQNMKAEDISAVFVAGLCSEASDVFNGGMKMRLDTTEAG
ncbi:MAG TPA: hypothetical protein VFV30_05320, partial [Novosphingobium sp.]|nr:hypothetical protein [Novosphingobium sp.]